MSEAACGKGIACTVYFSLSGIGINPNNTPCHGCDFNDGIKQDVKIARIESAQGVSYLTSIIGLFVHCLGYLPDLCDSQFLPPEFFSSQTGKKLRNN